ncbi:MAG TPA: LemA family protein [Microscillaceae bacterium]|nr:LemA family protein [Microscillaceae bacterium]
MENHIIIAIASGVASLIIIALYNHLRRKNNGVYNAFGGVETQLKKRFDLVPNLVAVVKKYASHEQNILTKVAEVRSLASSSALSNDQKVALDNQLAASMHGLLLSVENYPTIQASEGFNNLQRTLNELEAQISAARRTYNAVVTDYNNTIQTFPNNVMAWLMNLKTKHVFHIQDFEREPVSVEKLFQPDQL